MILWRKQTNAPNKFMGSGMLAPGAYVTLEHEYILIVRKGGKREFVTPVEKEARAQSAFFWEERNAWFSDVWTDLKGTSQLLEEGGPRGRSAAFPFELAYRLVNMFSVKHDHVLDPFTGSGTTMLAAMASCRNFAGFELEKGFSTHMELRLAGFAGVANAYIRQRLARHMEFVAQRQESKSGFKYANKPYGFPVMTRQETGLIFNDLLSITKDNAGFWVDYSIIPQAEFRSAAPEVLDLGETVPLPRPKPRKPKSPAQLQLFE